MTINQIWARNLKHRMWETDTTVIMLADRVKVSETAVYKWLDGGGPNLETLEKVAKALGTTSARLLDKHHRRAA